MKIDLLNAAAAAQWHAQRAALARRLSDCALFARIADELMREACS